MTVPAMHYIRRGYGRPLLLIHGLGGTWRSWSPILEALTAQRDVIAVDLPGFGDTPPIDGECTISALADAVTHFVNSHNLVGVDAVGSSMGARLVMELARRGGVLGHVVALDPGGFWSFWQKPLFYTSMYLSIRLVRVLQPFMHRITHSRLGRSLLFAQLSAHPSRLSPQLLWNEMHGYVISPSFDGMLRQLAYGEKQQGAPAGSLTSKLIIGWGRRDRICFRSQAKRALKLFPEAKLHWFNDCGHFPMWDAPEETVRLILEEPNTPPI